MSSLDPSAPDSTATQGPGGDVISAAPAQAVPPANAPAPAAPDPPGSPPAAPGPAGKVRGTGACIALSIVTFGIYSIVWFYKVHSEMKKHTGAGLGGGLAAVLALFVGIVMPFLTSGEVGTLYRRAGMAAPVSTTTGLWYFPGVFILIGPLVWFVKTNGALNSYWRSVGAA